MPKSIARQSGHLGRRATPMTCAVPAMANHEDRFDSAVALIAKDSSIGAGHRISVASE